jgi:UDP:flavonoid glycosyltransferase YjiC (YdhE family)
MRLLIPLFSPATGTWGGLTRVVAIATTAQEAGHEVAFCAAGYLAKVLDQRQFKVYPIPEGGTFSLPRPFSRRRARRIQNTRPPVLPGHSIGNIWRVFTTSGMARTRYLRQIVQAQIEAVRTFQPDALFTDLDPGAFLTAKICSLPVAATYASVITRGERSLPWRLLNRAAGTVQKAYGHSPHTVSELFFGPQVLKIIPSIPELDDTNPDRSDVVYVGQLIGAIQQVPDGAVFQPEPDHRYVFAYLGSGSLSLDTLRKVLPQAFPTESKTTCLVGSQSISRPETIGNVQFQPYINAQGVLPHCDWTLCHGGQNTVIQSLMNSVPLMIFPGSIFERRYNANKVQAAGAGWIGELDEFNLEWLHASLASYPICVPQAARLGHVIRSYGGASAAVDAIARYA